MGLDKPVWQQYFNWLGKMLKGDFGVSYFQQRPVIELLGKAFKVTARLALSSYVLAMFFGIAFGIIAAMARREKTALMEEEVARERRERGLEVLTPAQAAAMLNVTPADIRIRISHGSIKATRNGGRWQIPFSEVKRLQQRI